MYAKLSILVFFVNWAPVSFGRGTEPLCGWYCSARFNDVGEAWMVLCWCSRASLRVPLCTVLRQSHGASTSSKPCRHLGLRSCDRWQRVSDGHHRQQLDSTHSLPHYCQTHRSCQ